MRTPRPEGASSGGAVKILFTASGSLNMTSCVPLGANVIVNASPMCLSHLLIIHVGATVQISV